MIWPETAFPLKSQGENTTFSFAVAASPFEVGLKRDIP